MPFYEIETLLDCLKDLADREEEERKKKERKEGAANQVPNLNMNSMMRQMQSSMPQMPYKL